MNKSYLPDAIDLSRVKRALVIKLRHHGDVLLTSPVFSALSKAIPSVEIDALVYADTAPMLSEHPDIHTVHSIDRNWKKQGLRLQWREERSLMTALQNRHYDLIIHLTEHDRGRRLARRLRPLYSVAQSYPGKRGRRWQNSFTHTYHIPTRPRHTVEVHLDALRRLGIYPAVYDRKLTLNPGKAAEDRVAILFAEHGLEKNKYLLIHPTSRWMFKGWSQSDFASVLLQLQGAGHKLVLTSAPDAAEMEVVNQILTITSDMPVVNLAGALNLKELAALIGYANCFIGLDSVPMHIAAAMGTPCVALFGPSDEQTWGPWQVKNRVICGSQSCRPCGLDGCGNSKVSDCLMSIESQDVIAAVNELIHDPSK